MNEVRGLLGSIGDKTIGLSWTMPDLSFLLSTDDKQIATNTPSIVSYTVELFDVSLSDDKAAVADTKTVTVNHVAGQMVYSSTFTNLVNGRSYVPRVITRYTYQSNQGQKFKLTEGAFLNQPNTITSDFQVVNGRADVKTRVGITAYQSSAGGTGVIAVPGGIPIITPTLTGTNAGLQIDDNGRPLTFGAMIQIVGKPNNTVAAAANSFYIDLSTTVQSGGNAILDTKDAFKMPLSARCTHFKTISLEITGLLRRTISSLLTLWELEWLLPTFLLLNYKLLVLTLLNLTVLHHPTKHIQRQ